MGLWRHVHVDCVYSFESVLKPLAGAAVLDDIKWRFVSKQSASLYTGGDIVFLRVVVTVANGR